MKTAPDPIDVQEFLFKQSNIHQLVDAFTTIPVACSLLAADKKRGLLYAGYNNKIIVLKPREDNDPEWKIELDLPSAVSKIALNCECSYLAVAPHKPAVLIYDAQALVQNSLQLLHEIRISSASMDAFVSDLRWNPCVSGMLYTVASDHTVGSFQIKEEKESIIGLKALEKLDGLNVMCAAWSPKGKQIAVGCKNGNIVQLKPDLKVARTIAGPAPYIGEVISILWISNYQFCAAYLGVEQRCINVLIVDAPKGATVATFTCYEDITYGMMDAEGEGSIPRYYFDHVSEWGLIIAASSGSSEIAVLGSADGGVNWSQWQLVDSGRAQLPLICTTESYPVGITIDRSSVLKLPWGADSTLPHPVPILHILGTSGQLCSFHMVNLTPNSPAINVAPTEIVPVPAQPRLSIAPSEASMIMSGVITSTPRPKQPESIQERPKAAPVSNIFGDSLKVAGFFKQPQTETKKPKAPEQKIVQPPSAEIKVDPVKETPPQEVVKPDIKLAPVKEVVQQEPVEQKAPIDESICVRAYLEEQNLFEKELRNRLEPRTWECGTEEERKQLAERAAIIDQFLRDLRETTNSLSSDIAYLKALLLQSFAWVEETKSKNAATVDITTRTCGDNSKIAELQKLYYYTQTQLIQATKCLDLEWSDHKSQEKSRMKIPSLEFLYQNLVVHNKILTKEKCKLEQIKKRWKSITRSHNITGLNRSMSNLNIASPKSTTTYRGNSGVIEARCKTIASKTLSFTKEKQTTLKNLLLESTPRTIKPVNPSKIQDRLEATLSSLASHTSINVEVKTKAEQPVVKQQTPVSKQPTEKPKQQSPLASLNSIVASIGKSETNDILAQPKVQTKQPPTVASFPSMIGNKLPQTEKKTIVSPAVAQAKPKQEVTNTFGQLNTSTHGFPSLPKGFPKVDSISFGTPIQKPQETIMQKSPPKETSVKPKETVSNNDSIKVETNILSTGALKDSLTLDASAGKAQGILRNMSMTPAAIATTPNKTDAMATFSFVLPSNAAVAGKNNSLLSSQATNPQAFSFASKPSNIVPPTFKTPSPTAQSQPQVQGSLDLTGLALGLQQSNQTSSPANAEDGFGQKTMPTSFGVGGISINLVNNTSTKPAVATSPINVAEVPSTASKTSGLTGTPVQPLSAPSTGSFFGGQTTLTTSIFGGAPAATATPAPITSSTISSTSTFGSPPATSTISFASANAASAAPIVSTSVPSCTATSPFYNSLSKPVFGEAATNLPMQSFTGVSSAPSSTISFGTAAATTTTINPVFGKTTASPLGATSQFPAASTMSSPSNIFAKPVLSPSSIPFGSPSSTSVFGNVASGTSSTNIFGGGNTSSVFGGGTPASPSASIFGGNTTEPTTFEAPAAGSVFDNNAQKPGLAFSATSNSGTSFLGGAANNSTPPALVGSTAPSPSIFGGGTAGSPMGLASQPAFGQPPSFESKPVFDAAPSTFDSSKSVFGGTAFGSPAFGASAAPPAFGSPHPLGNSPGMDNNMSKVFGSTVGSSTFESLGSQSGGLTFGSLAQKSPEAEKTPSFGGGTSFSSWRS